MVALASGSAVGRRARATGVSGSARSPSAGTNVGIARTRSHGTLVVRDARRRRGCDLDLRDGSGGRSDPPRCPGLHRADAAVADLLRRHSGRSRRPAPRSRAAWRGTPAARRPRGRSGRALARRVHGDLRGDGRRGGEQRHVRSNDPSPRQRSSAASGVASASSAIACCSTGTPLAAVYGAKAAAAEGRSFAGGAACAAAGARSRSAAARARSERAAIKGNEPGTGRGVLVRAERPAGRATMVGTPVDGPAGRVPSGVWPVPFSISPRPTGGIHHPGGRSAWPRTPRSSAPDQ